VTTGNLSGKDIPAAIVISGVQSALRAFARGPAIGAATVVRELNRMLCDLYPERMQLSLFHCEIDCLKEQITWVNAGHHCPLLIRIGGAASLRLANTGDALCVKQRGSYEQRTAPFHPGDTLVAASASLSAELIVETVRRYPYDSSPDLAGRLLGYGAIHEECTAVVARSIEGAASRTSTSSPWGARFRHDTVPPHASTQLLTMASPSPAPPVSRCLANSGR